MENIVTGNAATALTALQWKMSGWTSASNLIRTTAAWVAFFAALTIGSVAASNDVGLSECDESGCAIVSLADVNAADFQMTEFTVLNIWEEYVSDGSTTVGFTR